MPARQAPLRLRDLGLDVLQRGVDVALEVELDRDVRRALARGGRDLLDALDRGDRVLEHVDDVRLHDLGGGALPGDGDVDDREVDVGVLADRRGPWKTVPTPVKQRTPKPIRANIRIHAKTWLRIEMSARVIPVAIFWGSSAGSPPAASPRSCCPASPRRRRRRALRAAAGSRRRTTSTACRRRGGPSPPSRPSRPASGPRGSRRSVPVRRPIWIGRTPGRSLLDDVGHEAPLARLHGALGHHERVLAGSPASVTSAKKPGLSTPGFSTQARTSTWRVAGSATRPTW